MKTTLQEQARALGDATRHAIFRYVADAGRPVDVAELTEFLGLNHNAIRQHLAKLVSAGLVTEAHAAARGRGRPRLVYEIDPSTESRWGVAGPYERLSVLLTEMLRTGDAAVEVGERSVGGGRYGRVEDPIRTVADAMAREGFDPAVREHGDRTELVLRNCPFETAALADPATVCEIHLGIARGVAQLTGDRVVIDELVPHDPRRANCQLRLHVVEEVDEEIDESSASPKPRRKSGGTKKRAGGAGGAGRRSGRKT
jgi:predicted ArsR family transcriptional regulator